MQIQDFRTIVTTFADPGTEILFEYDTVVISVNGDIIEASISVQEGDVMITESGLTLPASRWILTRLAKLQLLATRLKETLKPLDHFVTPDATVLHTLSTSTDDSPVHSEDAVQSVTDFLTKRSPLETTVLYITSDAGEGKTSVINQIAHIQAVKYSESQANWLLVPIPLGGRHFLRFDDITVGALQNRYRFPFLYYASFISLVRMGVIIPAFDGFEEMFVEGSSGEALSAMGILVSSMNSSGAIVVAARKAYFEFENLKTQERLFDTIRHYAVGFGKIELKRWERSHFVEYSRHVGITNPESLYDKVKERLGDNHALLTRPVLVKRLVTVAKETASLDRLLELIHNSGPDYFSVFVRSIIEREANEKWIDRSGESEAGAPLLSVEEHFGLLSEVSVAMWESRVDYLKRESLAFVADYFCESRKKSPQQTQQVRERIRGHALFIASPNAADAVEFDHDEFRLFFLGEGLATLMKSFSDRARVAVHGVLRRGSLSKQAVHSCVHAVKRMGADHIREAIGFLLSVARLDGQTSYTQENVSSIVIRVLSGYVNAEFTLDGLSFGADSLRDRKVSKVVFSDCYFAPTSLEHSEIRNCVFSGCTFTQIRVFASTTFEDVTFADCQVDGLVVADEQREFWAPDDIAAILIDRGVAVVTGGEVLKVEEQDPATQDPRVRDVERVLRYLMRSTHIGEKMIMLKLGQRGAMFLDYVIPELLAKGIFEELEDRGSNQRRFRLLKSSQSIHEAVRESGGSFEAFTKILTDAAEGS